MEKHIDPQRFKKVLTKDELHHLSVCRFCREELTEYVEAEEIILAPRDFKNSVMEQSRRLDVKLIAGTNHVSKRLQLFYFSLKVGAAILCVLTMLTIAPELSRQLEGYAVKVESKSEEPPQNTWNYYEKVNNLTARLNRLSNKNMEVFDYDKKEK